MSLLSRLRDWLRPTPPAPLPPGPPTPGGDALALHNAERTSRGLAALTTDARLTAAAQRHADWMARTGRMTHGGEGQPWDRVSEAGYRWSYVGENIAECEDLATAMRLWMNSSGHRANILSANFTQMGFGNAGRFWCADFARPA